jgi:hypothetical protein
MKKERVWSVSVQSVEREEICFAPNTEWQVQAQGYRLYFNADRPIELQAQDQMLITAGEGGTPTWAAFIGTAVECSPDSILLYTSPQYEPALMDIKKLVCVFSPLSSIEGAQHVIERFGLFPSFHYDEITNIDRVAAEQQDIQKNLSVTIRHTSIDGLEQLFDFYFEDIQQEILSPIEACNICLQLSFTY